MKAGQMVLRVGAVIGLLGWAALAFWVFSFGYSDSFFLYSLRSRLPPFLAAFSGALALPVLTWRHWSRATRGSTSPLAACICQTLGGGVCLLPLAAASYLLSHATGPWRLSGDDAMGVGIDFVLLAVLAAASVLGLAAAFLLRSAWRSEGGRRTLSTSLRAADPPASSRFGLPRSQ